MPSGLNKFLEIENNSDFKIKEIQLSTSDGLLLNPVMKSGGEALTPKGFVLYQNYPNPFNPTTGIAFALPDMSPATLTVFNVLGQEVITLVDEMLPAGQHSVVWNGRDNHGNAVSSGIYFYRLHAGRFLAEKKMILLK